MPPLSLNPAIDTMLTAHEERIQRLEANTQTVVEQIGIANTKMDGFHNEVHNWLQGCSNQLVDLSNQINGELKENKAKLNTAEYKIISLEQIAESEKRAKEERKAKYKSLKAGLWVVIGGALGLLLKEIIVKVF
jgi:chromosome segregation ATPase